MSQLQQTLTMFVLTLLVATTVRAQHHHFPNISGRYDTNSPEICTIVQDGKTVHLSSNNPGVTQFDFSGVHGQRQHVSRDRRLHVVRVGFHGQYRIAYADGRSPVEGYVSLIRTQNPHVWSVNFFRLEGQNLVETESRTITRIGTLSNGGGNRETADPNDEFDLLSEGDLDDLGI